MTAKRRQQPAGKKRAAAKKPGAVRDPALLTWCAIAVGIGFCTMLLIRLSNAPVFEVRLLFPYGGYALALFGVYRLLRANGHGGDRGLLCVCLLLGGIGHLIQFRVGTHDWENPYNIANYMFFAGALALVVTTLLLQAGRYRVLEAATLLSALGTVVILAAILLLGQRFRGMVFMPGNVNPSELVKLLLVVFLSGFFVLHAKELQGGKSTSAVPPMTTLLPLAMFWCIPMGLLVLQRDLGMIVQMNILLLVMWFVWTGRIVPVVLGLAAIAVAGYAIVRFDLHGHQRIEIWLNPFSNPTGGGWQVLQSLSALYTGGLLGTGIGVGAPQAVPIAASDFVYAVLGEELGFAGGVAIVTLYLILIYRGYAIAARTKDPFGHLLAVGITTTLAVQAVLNIGGVTKALPLTGITLPFVSQGGSSLLTSFAMVGILLAISDEGKKPARKGAKRVSRKKKD